MTNTIVIPVSTASERLRNKPLRLIGGEPLVVRTVKQATRCEGAGRVIVVCDCLPVKDAVAGFCDYVVLIDDPGVWCGTHRVALTVGRYPDLFPKSKWTSIVNWQVDEPFVDPEDVSRLIAVRNSQVYREDIGTLVCPIEESDRSDPDVVKAMVPRWSATAPGTAGITWFTREARRSRAWRHLGVYAFAAPDVAKIGMLSPTKNAKENRLEQLAWEDAGYRLFGVHGHRAEVSVDTEEDLERANELVQ